jgi:outer membrane protein OmpA-like peptidoglycan-associated protein
MYTEVPAHVQHEHYSRNGVAVRAGTNWDFSRLAVETPVVQLPAAAEPCDCGPPAAVSAYHVQDRMPQVAPSLTLRFGANSAVLTTAAMRDLRTLPASRAVVAGHASAQERTPDALAQRRARAVESALRRYGHRVEHVRGFGATRPLDGAAQAAAHRRADIWLEAKP